MRKKSFQINKIIKIAIFHNHIKILSNVNRITERMCQFEIIEYA